MNNSSSSREPCFNLENRNGKNVIVFKLGGDELYAERKVACLFSDNILMKHGAVELVENYKQAMINAAAMVAGKGLLGPNPLGSIETIEVDADNADQSTIDLMTRFVDTSGYYEAWKKINTMEDSTENKPKPDSARKYDMDCF